MYGARGAESSLRDMFFMLGPPHGLSIAKEIDRQTPRHTSAL